ncbi:hypothetical protein [Alkalicoccus luteus]|uniref:Uncharacterized protein n=1 Tax=Alkalicoccus luteus TaxID=1237094 RepID=A0A969PNF3_9BACI|nr:hypothetical protein [Alkalicoccus luteus]NJP37406.1 hypothetical protein [Alkalicoccus luteus]
MKLVSFVSFAAAALLTLAACGDGAENLESENVNEDPMIDDDADMNEGLNEPVNEADET